MKIFERIYKNNAWGGRESVSGRGSDLDHTGRLLIELDTLLREYDIKTILDIPCGDFNWMKEVNLMGIKYIGGDIVKELVDGNKKYARRRLTFEQMDITTSDLPSVDLVLVRDCLTHFSYEDIYKAINNIKRSKSKYLLTTSFTQKKSNSDIITGDWRPLNLLTEPFNFPKPIKIINEEYKREPFTDKSMCLWDISIIPN